mgnify:CR=1 FL=1
MEVVIHELLVLMIFGYVMMLGHPESVLAYTSGQASFGSRMPSQSVSRSPVIFTTRLDCAVFPAASITVNVTV